MNILFRLAGSGPKKTRQSGNETMLFLQRKMDMEVAAKKEEGEKQRNDEREREET